MKHPVLFGGLALALALGASGPALADSPSKVQVAKHGRFAQYDLKALGKITGLPRSLTTAKQVSALVQIAGDPVATQEAAAAAAGTAFDPAAAKAAVVADQNAVLPDIKAAGAKVEGRLTTVLNAVRVNIPSSRLAALAAVPGVTAVQISHAVSRSNKAGALYTSTPLAWQNLGLTGAGQKIGIIDDGIDYTHADFGGPGTVAAYDTNDGTIIEPGTFPTTKVIGGYDFVGDAYNADDTSPAYDPVPVPDPDPLGCGEHGTHVAGTAAGQGVLSTGATYTGPYTSAALTGTAFNVAPGMAPQASLLAYKVFGCAGSVNDDIIVAAVDRAVADGASVINLSLGSTFGTSAGLDIQAINNATASGVLVVASAGNEGPGAYVVGGPSTATTALSVAAIDATTPTVPGVGITGAATVSAQLSNDIPVSSPITAPLVYVGYGVEGDSLTTAVAGKIVVADRGAGYARVDRAIYGQANGALAVILVDNAPAPALPPIEGQIVGPNGPVTIPFLGVNADDGAALIAAAGGTVTLTGGVQIPNPAYTNSADFTSAGPRRLDSAPKPDISAPGVSLLSAGRGTGTEGFTLSGTSMASPLTAGIAALARQGHPGWTPQQVKAALQSTADASLIGDYDTARNGTGVVSAQRAGDTVAYGWTPDDLNALAFGVDQVQKAYSETKSYRITNRSKSSITYDLSAQFASGSFGSVAKVTPASVTVKAGKTTTVSLTLSWSKAALAALPPAGASDGGTLVSVNGAVVATPRAAAKGVYSLRTAFLAVVQPRSNITAERTNAGLRLKNSGLHSGDADVYAWQISDRVGDIANSEVADVVSAGVQSFPGGPDSAFLVFAVNTAKATSTQATHEFDVLIDTNRDGTPDFVAFATDFGLVTSGSPDGTLGTFVYDLNANAYVYSGWAVGPANGSVVELGVPSEVLGLTSAQGAFDWTVSGYTILDTTLPGDDTTTATYNPFAPVVETGQWAPLAPGESAVVSAAFDRTQRSIQTHLGWLVITLDDTAGAPSGTLVKLSN